ncbi:hypothetical protein SNEBB_007559 [Seison nebaliae]|nr:hypothetical protein SNEBB_007559 [Seison nebaliae]
MEMLANLSTNNDNEKSEKLEKNNSNEETNEIKKGSAKQSDKIPTVFTEKDYFLSLLGILRKVSLAEIKNYAFEKGIEVKQISIIDKYPNGIRMNGKFAKIIICMDKKNFDKAFDEALWPEGITLKKSFELSNRYMSTRCSNLFPLGETFIPHNHFQTTKTNENRINC